MSVTMHVDEEPIPGLDAEGRPDPGYAQRLGLVPAPGGRRAAAFALDALVWVVLAVPGAIGLALLGGAIAAAGGDPTAVDAGTLTLPLVLVAVSQGLLLVFGLVQLTLHGRRGRTLGKSAFGIRSVQVATFGPAGFWRIVLRVLVLWGGQVVLPFAGPAVLFASSSWDPESRGRSWLDRVGRCFAVDVRGGLDPFDAKALRHARRTLDAPQAVPVRLPSLASDRAVDEHTFIPATRSSSAVVSLEADDWMPPSLLSPTDRTGWAPPVAASAPAPPSSPITMAPLTAAGSAAPPNPTAPDAGVVLVFDDGTRVSVRGHAVIGRDPAAGSEVLRIPLSDPERKLSKTHASIAVDVGGAVVTDRASTNGTGLVQADGVMVRLDPWTPTHVPTGATVHVGGRSFSVIGGAR